MGIPALIYCADGNPSFAAVARETGWLYGARLPSTVYEDVYFADQDWKNPKRAKYMESLERHKPRMCTVLDWEQEDQFDEVMDWSKEASSYVDKIVIICKVPGTVHKVPDEVLGKEIVLGFSVPTSYGGSAIGLWEFENRPVHLLGGSPQKQMDLAHYLNVVSVDGNMAHQQAHKCRFWSNVKTAKGRWNNLSITGDCNSGGANLRAFRLSMSNIKMAWERRDT